VGTLAFSYIRILLNLNTITEPRSLCKVGVPFFENTLRRFCSQDIYKSCLVSTSSDVTGFFGGCKFCFTPFHFCIVPGYVSYSLYTLPRDFHTEMVNHFLFSSLQKFRMLYKIFCLEISLFWASVSSVIFPFSGYLVTPVTLLIWRFISLMYSSTFACILSAYLVSQQGGNSKLCHWDSFVTLHVYGASLDFFSTWNWGIYPVCYSHLRVKIPKSHYPFFIYILLELHIGVIFH
jgi:hypothetical protein